MHEKDLIIFTNIIHCHMHGDLEEKRRLRTKSVNVTILPLDGVTSMSQCSPDMRSMAVDIYLIGQAVYELLFQGKQKPQSSWSC